MAGYGTSGRIFVFGALLALAVPAASHAADARTPNHAQAVTVLRGGRGAARTIQAGMRQVAWHGRKGHAAARYVGGGLQCVPFARDESGIELTGNAATWWNQAAGLYERGNRPEVGSVLNFKPNSYMRLGHVAVVTAVVNSREIEIDQANWGPRPGRVSRGITVMDVSQDNDWTAVRVALGSGDDFGSIYPTYGFIYDRADRGTLLAAAPSAAPAPDLNPPARDLRDAADRGGAGSDGAYEEVADAPADAAGIGMAHHAAHRRAWFTPRRTAAR